MPQAYTYHKRSCPKAKKRLSDALAKANEVWQAKKRRKTEGMAQSQAVECCSNPADMHSGILPPLAGHPQVRFRAHSTLSLIKRFYLSQSIETTLLNVEDRSLASDVLPPGHPRVRFRVHSTL